MKEFVIISGTQNSGKTTTAWCVYQRFLPYSCNTQMWFGNTLVTNHGEIVYKDAPHSSEPRDFKVFLDVYGYKIVIISAGDDAKLLHSEIHSAYNEADFIIISLRTYNKTGSSRRMLRTYYTSDYKKEFRAAPRDSHLSHPLDIVNSKRLVADRIFNYVLFQTKYNLFK